MADATVVANVRSYVAETDRGATHVERWKRVLIGLGVESHADYGWSRWDPVATELSKAEAAAQ